MHRVHSLMSNTISRHCMVVRPPVLVLIIKKEVIGYILIRNKSQLKSVSQDEHRNVTINGCAELTADKMIEHLQNLSKEPEVSWHYFFYVLKLKMPNMSLLLTEEILCYVYATVMCT